MQNNHNKNVTREKLYASKMRKSISQETKSCHKRRVQKMRSVLDPSPHAKVPVSYLQNPSRPLSQVQEEVRLEILVDAHKEIFMRAPPSFQLDGMAHFML